MDQQEHTTTQDTVLEIHAILDLADANLAPVDTNGDWATEAAFLEGEHQRDRTEAYTLNTLLDGVSEQG